MGAVITVQNDTPFVMQMSLEQLGPLYYSNSVQPGGKFYRNTGAVHFTIKCRWYQGKDINQWHVAAPIIIATAGAVFGAMLGGALVAAPAAAAIGAADAVAIDGLAVAGGVLAGGALGTGLTACGTVIHPSGPMLTTEIGGQKLHWVDSERNANLTASLKECVKKHKNWFQLTSRGWFAGNKPNLRLVGGPKLLGRDKTGIPILDISSGTPLKLEHM